MLPLNNPTARVQRGESSTARCASTEDRQPPSPSSCTFHEQEDDQVVIPSKTGSLFPHPVKMRPNRGTYL